MFAVFLSAVVRTVNKSSIFSRQYVAFQFDKKVFHLVIIVLTANENQIHKNTANTSNLKRLRDGF